MKKIEVNRKDKTFKITIGKKTYSFKGIKKGSCEDCPMYNPESKEDENFCKKIKNPIPLKDPDYDGPESFYDFCLCITDLENFDTYETYKTIEGAEELKQLLLENDDLDFYPTENYEDKVNN